MESETTETLHPHHVLLVSFPSQGHVNPLLRLAKRIASEGLYVTFSTTQFIGNLTKNSINPDTPFTIGQGQLRFEYFNDGWEDDDIRRGDLDAYVHQIATFGRESFVKLLNKQASFGRPVSFIINNHFIPWVADLATEMGIPSAVLWVQSCAVYSVYYHYFHNLVSFPTLDQPDHSVHIPGLPKLESHEIPSFLHPLNPPMYQPLKNAVLSQFKNLEKSFCVLVDSFEEIEHEAIKPMMKTALIRPVGPLFKLKDGDSVRADMMAANVECLEWLHTKPASSVVYVSFGSIACVGNKQMEEIARGLLNSGQPFLWVVKPPLKQWGDDRGRLPEGFVEEAEGKGLIVEWCPQERVLEHPSVACFLTHCGWNSSMEILGSGIPVVASPQWGDQVTNAKFLVDVCGVGVRLLNSERDLETLTREKVEECIIEVTRGPKAGDFKKNALKWKKIAEDAATEGGSSYGNLKAFIDDIRRTSLEQ